MTNSSTKKFNNETRAIFAYGRANRIAFTDDSRGYYAGWEFVDATTGDVKCAVPLGYPEPRESDAQPNQPDRYMATMMLFHYSNFFGLVQCFVNKGDVINQRLRYQLNIGGQTNLVFYDDRSTIVDEFNNHGDRSREIQVYKKVGVVAMLANNICCYADTELLGQMNNWNYDGVTGHVITYDGRPSGTPANP